MLEYEKFLKDIDLDNLGKKFSEKRNSFIDKISPKGHKLINQKQLICAISLDLCLLLFQEYMTKYANTLTQLNEIEKKRLENVEKVISNAAQSREELNKKFPNQQKTEKTFEFYELDLAQLYLTLSQAKDMNEINSLAYNIKIDTLHLSLIGVVESFDSLISKNDPSLLKEKIISITKLVIGVAGLPPTILSPIISLFSLGWEIYDYTKKEEARLDTANDILFDLDNFSSSTYVWSITAQMLIDFDFIGTNLRGTIDDKTLLYEQLMENARIVVNNKLENMYNDINKKMKDVATS